MEKIHLRLVPYTGLQCPLIVWENNIDPNNRSSVSIHLLSTLQMTLNLAVGSFGAEVVICPTVDPLSRSWKLSPPPLSLKLLCEINIFYCRYPPEINIQKVPILENATVLR